MQNCRGIIIFDSGLSQCLSIGHCHGREKCLEQTSIFFNFEVTPKSPRTGIELARQLKKTGGKVNVVVKGPVGEFSNSEKIGKGKY